MTNYKMENYIGATAPQNMPDTTAGAVIRVQSFSPESNCS